MNACPTAQLSPDALRVLREIVRECLRAQQMGASLPDETAVSAAVELIETGFMRLECCGRSLYRLVPVEPREGLPDVR